MLQNFYFNGVNMLGENDYGAEEETKESELQNESENSDNNAINQLKEENKA